MRAIISSLLAVVLVIILVIFSCKPKPDTTSDKPIPDESTTIGTDTFTTAESDSPDTGSDTLR